VAGLAKYLYHLGSNPGRAMLEGCFIFHFASLHLEVTQSIWLTLCTKVAVKRINIYIQLCLFKYYHVFFLLQIFVFLYPYLIVCVCVKFLDSRIFQTSVIRYISCLYNFNVLSVFFLLIICWWHINHIYLIAYYLYLLCTYFIVIKVITDYNYSK